MYRILREKMVTQELLEFIQFMYEGNKISMCK